MFSERLKQLRGEKGVSQKEVAAVISVAPSTYTLYEGGKREPNFTILCKLALYFNVSTDYLLGISAYKNQQEKITYDYYLNEINHLISLCQDDRRRRFIQGLFCLMVNTIPDPETRDNIMDFISELFELFSEIKFEYDNYVYIGVMLEEYKTIIPKISMTVFGDKIRDTLFTQKYIDTVTGLNYQDVFRIHISEKLSKLQGAINSISSQLCDQLGEDVIKAWENHKRESIAKEDKNAEK